MRCSSFPRGEPVRLPHDLLGRWAARARIEARSKQIGDPLGQPDEQQDAGDDGDGRAHKRQDDGDRDQDHRGDDAGPEERLIAALLERDPLTDRPDLPASPIRRGCLERGHCFHPIAKGGSVWAGQWAQEQIVSPSSRRSNWSPQRAQVGGSSLARTKRARIMAAQKARYGTTSAGEFMLRLIGRAGLLV